MQPNRGFTLVELLVVIAIISILAGITIPAVQSFRTTARSMECRHNLNQIVFAVSGYYSTHRQLPPSYVVRKDPVLNQVYGSWSVHGRILPYAEQTNAHRKVDLNRDWHDQVDTGVTYMSIPMYTCPAEVNTEIRTRDNMPYVRGTNYGFNMGTWFIFDPVTGETGDGAFTVNEGRQYTSVKDGLSYTLMATDVKNYQSYIRNVNMIDPTFPTSADQFNGLTGELRLGPQLADNTGHTVWCDGRVHHTGMTTTFAPNTLVTYDHGGQTYDIDYNSQQIEKDATRPTFAAVTSRSYHPGGINAAFLDGSVRFVAEGIDPPLWLSLGCVDDSKVVTSGL